MDRSMADVFAAKLREFFAADARGTAAVYLSGSVACGTADDDSDIDVAVLFEQNSVHCNQAREKVEKRAEDEIRGKRDSLIESLERRLARQSETARLFTLP